MRAADTPQPEALPVSWPLKRARLQSVTTKSMFSRSSFLPKQESRGFWIPGRVSLARNDVFPDLSSSGSLPGRAEGLPVELTARRVPEPLL